MDVRVPSYVLLRLCNLMERSLPAKQVTQVQSLAQPPSLKHVTLSPFFLAQYTIIEITTTSSQFRNELVQASSFESRDNLNSQSNTMDYINRINVFQKKEEPTFLESVNPISSLSFFQVDDIALSIDFSREWHCSYCFWFWDYFSASL